MTRCATRARPMRTGCRRPVCRSSCAGTTRWSMGSSACPRRSTRAMTRWHSSGLRSDARSVPSTPDMAVLDVAGFVADLKDHAVEHGFHVHDERHFVESYSLRQTWEVDLHPEEGCEGPVDLYLSLDIDPRVLLGFEDAVIAVADDDDPNDRSEERRVGNEAK